MQHLTSKSMSALAAVLLAILVAGCGANSGREVHQFDPAPRAEAAERDLAPVQPGATLLHEAEAEFALAKAAREEGKTKEAQRHYDRMVQLLRSANVDPSVFSEVQQNFEHQDSAAKLAQILARHNTGKFPKGELHIGTGGIVVPDPLPDPVVREIDRIVNGYPRSFQYGLNESGKYLPSIRAKFKAAGLPEDLCWLAMVESQFTPNIVSHAGAGGMWQFMPETGRRYGLNRDTYVDERFDWRASTDAAIGYLTDLKTMFNGDWALALSAYNMGENGVARICGACGEKDWWKLLDHPTGSGMVPDETKQYYAKFVATLIAASDPASFGFSPITKVLEASVGVPISGRYSFSQIDKALGCPSGTIERLNPTLIKKQTPPGRMITLNVPRDAEPRFVTAMAKLKEIRDVEFASHKVKKGDTLGAIARKYHTTTAELLRANKMKSGAVLKVGQVLKAPVKGGVSVDDAGESIEVASNDAPEKPAKEAPRAKSGGGTALYTVKKGDTLFDIAEATGTSVEEIRRLNKFGPKTSIYAGQDLKVAAAAPARAKDAAPAEKTRTHVAQAGDYPAKIARTYDMGLDEFLKLNALGKNDTISIGQELKVRMAKADTPAKESKLAKAEGGSAAKESKETAKAAKEPAAKAASAKKSGKRLVHKVAPGDTPSGIAKHYGVTVEDFLAWNGLSQGSVLHPGEEQVLYVTASAPAGVSASSEKESEAETTAKKRTRAPAASGPARAEHTVGKGQNPSTIARLHGVKVSDLYRWNNWSKDHVLQVGDTVAYFK